MYLVVSHSDITCKVTKNWTMATELHNLQNLTINSNLEAKVPEMKLQKQINEASLTCTSNTSSLSESCNRTPTLLGNDQSHL